jgi:hypothetical protein
MHSDTLPLDRALLIRTEIQVAQNKVSKAAFGPKELLAPTVQDHDLYQVQSNTKKILNATVLKIDGLHRRTMVLACRCI